MRFFIHLLTIFSSINCWTMTMFFGRNDVWFSMSVKQRQRGEFGFEIDFAIHHDCNIKKSVYRSAKTDNYCCNDYQIRSQMMRIRNSMTNFEELNANNVIKKNCQEVANVLKSRKRLRMLGNSFLSHFFQPSIFSAVKLNNNVFKLFKNNNNCFVNVCDHNEVNQCFKVNFWSKW